MKRVNRKKIPVTIEVKQIWAIVLLFLNLPSNALVPLENVLLGNYQIDAYEETSDPLSALFRDYDDSLQNQTELKKPIGMSEELSLTDRELFRSRIKLGLFRGYIEEGFNLETQCKTRPEISYATLEDKTQAMRAYLATIQYLTLDLTTHYLPLYAKFFEFSEDDYTNLVNNLVGNFCSQNLTTLSLRQLKLNMIQRYKVESNYKLPSVKGNPYFPERLARQESRRSARESEFAWTVELFKASCSWGNEVDNFRLLVPILRSPAIAAMVIRELSGQSLSWSDEKSSPTLETSNKTSRIACQNLVCRKLPLDKFLTQIPRSVGSTSIRGDFERLYCNEFRDADFKIRNQIPKIAERIKEITFDEQNMLIGQLVALSTGVPDFLIQSPKFDDLKESMRSSLDMAWDFWAKGQNENFKKGLGYEEPLKIQVVETEIFFRKFHPDFEVHLDINQGEFDRVNSIVGKLKTKMGLKFSKKFLQWARDQWKSIDPTKQKNKVERIKIPFRKMVEDQIETLISSYPIVPLTKKIDELIVDEIIKQLDTYEGNFFSGDQEGFLEIPVYVNYGIFALRHMHDRYNIKRNQGDIVSDLQKLRSLRL